jgi:RNA polymerase sigma factor (TIGR02999 family)
MNALPDTAPKDGEITRMLDAARAGDVHVWNRLVALVYAELSRLAHGVLGRRGRDQTLDTGALVNECYLRMAGANASIPQDRVHFFALSARVMRQVICDYARERLADKRGNNPQHIPLHEMDVQAQQHIEQFVELDEALTRLARRNERLAHVVECRFFAGLTDEETATALGTSVRTVRRDWQTAHRWLTRTMA